MCKDKELIINDLALENNYNLFCLSELWCKEGESPYIGVDNFCLASSYCKKVHIRGGVAIFIDKLSTFSENILDLDFLNDEQHFESMGIVIYSFQLVIVSLYRSLNGNCDIFLENKW